MVAPMAIIVSAKRDKPRVVLVIGVICVKPKEKDSKRGEGRRAKDEVVAAPSPLALRPSPFALRPSPFALR